MSSENNVGQGASGHKNERPTRLVGHPTVLIADDEELIREVTCIMIQDNGGSALIAGDGIECLKVFQEHLSQIDVVVMDYSMPRKNGYQAYQELLKLKPSIKVLFMSGLKGGHELQALQSNQMVKFLGKPFHEAEFIRCLNELLEQSPA
jgi:two-component system, cell cycle sensor histidine kinase and response regulator CckA